MPKKRPRSTNRLIRYVPSWTCSVIQAKIPSPWPESQGRIFFKDNMSESAPAVDPQRERIYRRNFGFFLTDGILFSVAMGVLGQTTLIPDFIRHLTSSEVLIGFSS